MSAKLSMFFLTLFMIVLGHGCSRSPAGKVGGAVATHHYDERAHDWIVDLPATATSQEVISNYFRVLLLHDGKPVASDKLTMLDGSGKVVAELAIPIQKVGRYNILDEWTAWCPGGGSKEFVMDTDIGRKQVSVELARNHSDNPAATGWRCTIADAPTNAGTNHVQP